MAQKLESETQEKTWKLRQEEVNYTPLSAQRGKACATCRWFNPYGDWRDDSNIATCHLVSDWPDTILATGLCDRHEIVEPEVLEPDPLPVVIVELGTDEKALGASETEKAVERVLMKPGILKRFWEMLPGMRKAARPQAQFKSLGSGWWVGWYSNNFEDREAEIIAGEAHDKFIARLNAGIMPMPELWFWHIPGTKHGKAAWVDRIGHMVVSLGRFDDTPLGRLMETHYEAADATYAMSHGFTADKSRHFRDGVWYDINTFEMSTLAPEAAANVWTLFSEVKSMASEQALAALKDILVKGLGQEAGDAEYDKILSATEAMNKEVAALGVRYKDFSDPAKVEAPDTAALEAFSKNAAPLLIDLTKDMADAVNTQTALSAEIDALKKGREADLLVIAALKTQVEALQAAASLTPRRASAAAETALAGEIVQELNKRAAEIDDYWGDMQVKKS